MIVVTGASGYIGSHIVRQLAAAGKPVRAIVNHVSRAVAEGRLQGLEIELVEADVTRPESLLPALDGASAVIHTVAIAIEKNGRTYEQINYQGTINVVEAARTVGAKRFIYLSQLGADSGIPYRFLASKGKGEEYVSKSGLDWTSFKPSVIWGPEDEFANTFAKLIPLTPLIFPIIGDENSKFQPVWVDDVAAALIKALDDPTSIGKIYELGGPEILTLEEIERRTLTAVGAQRTMIHFPMSLIRLAVAAIETLFPAPPVTRSLLELLAVSNVTVNNAIQEFVSNPRPFTAENAGVYMKAFSVKQTLRQFMGKV